MTRILRMTTGLLIGAMYAFTLGALAVLLLRGRR